MAEEQVAQEESLDRLTQIADTSDLPSADPSINKFNNAVKDPATGRFVKAATPNTDTPPPPAPEPTPEPETVDLPTPAPAQQPKQPQLTPLIRAMADRLGVPQHLLQGDPDQVRRDIEMLYKMSQGQAPAQPGQPGANAPEDDFDLGIDDKEYPEFTTKVKGHFKTLKGQLQEQNQQIRQLLEQNRQYQQQQEISQFESLCAKNPEVFGAGNYNELDPNGIEAARRAMLWQQLENFYQGRPKSDLPRAYEHFKKVFVTSSQAAPPPAPKAPPVDPSNRITPEQWAKAGVLPASQRTGKEAPMSRFERMVREEARRQQVNGQAAVAAGFDDNSDLPKHPG